MSHVRQRHTLALAAAAVALTTGSAALAQTPVIDGTRDASYGAPFAVQTVNTEFGDNQSELNAGYARIENGKLYLMLTGNIESNFNKLVVFFDTRAGGQNVMRSDNPDLDFNNINTKYAGMTHDANFSPDYMMFWSRNTDEVFLNFTELNTNGGGLGGFLGTVATPNPNQQGSGTVGGFGGLPTVEFGYDDSNTAGVVGGPDAADQTAAAAVATGHELAFDLPAIGALGDIKIMVGINGSSHDFWSNQFLAGLTPPQGNLGGDGLGNFTGDVSLVNFANIPGDQFVTLSYTAPLSEWNFAGNGNWSDAARWNGGVPDAIDARAVLGTLGGAGARTVTLDTDVRLQSITFDNPDGYTIAASGANALTIAGNPATPSVVVNSGNHTIAAPVILGATTNFNIAAAGGLNITGDLTATGQTIVKTGQGALTVPYVRANGLFISEGTVRVAPNGTAAGTSTVFSLGFEGGTTPVGRFDLTNNALVVDYDPPPPPEGEPSEPFDTIRAQIISAYNNGAWDGPGITSSLANSSSHGLGYAESSDLNPVPAIFGTVDEDAVLVRYTRYGDANLDGLVNLADFNRLAANFGSADANWVDGDFNYDGNVNLADFNRLAANFGLQAGPDGPTPEDWSNLAAAVPEPGMLSVITLGAALMLRRKRE